MRSGVGTLGFLLVVVAVVGGCGAHHAASDVSDMPTESGANVALAATEVTSTSAPRVLRRSDVKEAVHAGLGAFLQHVVIDDQPVFANGRFKGFRVAGLQGDRSFWRGVDLRPGDVIMRVNGKVIERPEQALDVFNSLPTAPELRISMERDGKPRELVYPIQDAPAR